MEKYVVGGGKGGVHLHVKLGKEVEGSIDIGSLWNRTAQNLSPCKWHRLLKY